MNDTTPADLSTQPSDERPIGCRAAKKIKLIEKVGGQFENRPLTVTDS